MSAVMDVYVRVSRKGEREGKSFRSPKIQRSEAKAWAQRNGVRTGLVEEELDVSGGKAVADRKLEALVRRVEQGASAGIIVPKLSRFARNLSETVKAAERVIKAGGRLVATEDGYDSTMPGAMIILGTLGGLAEHERDLRTAGWRKATAGAVEEGIHVACRAPIGYLRRDRVEQRYDARGKLIRDGRLVVDPDAEPHVLRAFELRAEGRSYGYIANYLKQALGRDGFAKSSVAGLLSNRAYLGEARGPNGVVNKTAHEAIVSPELFAAAQPRSGVYHPRDGSLAEQARLGGLIRCAACGHKLRVMGTTNGKSGKREASYVCATKYAGGDCPAPAAARVSLVDGHVVEALADAWADVAAGAESAEQRFLRAREEVRAAELALDAWVDDPTIAVTVGQERFTRGLKARQQALEDAQARLWEMDDPGIPEGAHVVTLDGRPWLYEVWGQDPAADRRHLRRYIGEVTLAKADPRRRRWQPIAERVAVTWRGAEEEPAAEEPVAATA